MAALNTLQSNFAIVDAIRKSGGSLNQQALPEMEEWCRRAGYKVCGIRHSQTEDDNLIIIESDHDDDDDDDNHG